VDTVTEAENAARLRANAHDEEADNEDDESVVRMRVCSVMVFDTTIDCTIIIKYW